MITALYADERGEIYDRPGYGGVGRIGAQTVALKKEDLIKLPDGADLMFLPERAALGEKNGRIVPIEGQAVSAILPAGYTRTHLPAFQKTSGAKMLPLYGYTAVVLYRDELYAAAAYTDENAKWRPDNYNTPQLKKLVRRTKKDLPGNRIVEQVGNCSLNWHCCTAQNLFYRRWEAGIPTSPACNANCFGCISLQPSECCPSPQSRIDFTPTPEEIAEVGVYHLSGAPEAIVSFGQGCEGEPSLAADAIASGIRRIREKTRRGVININTNAGYTEGIAKIAGAGLDAMRVSMISAAEDVHQAYYRGNYTLGDVRASIALAKKAGVYVSLNLLYFPGLNDREEELAAWKTFLAETKVDMIQMRNLNIDPDAFMDIMPMAKGKTRGARAFMRELKAAFPKLAIGSFSHYVKK